MRVHRISGGGIAAFGASSKLNAEWDFLRLLRDEGRRTADAFLAAHAGSLGLHQPRSTWTFAGGALIPGPWAC
jgi:NTE family protein